MPKWLENAVFYEIYPQSFQDTNGDGIGDFQGIIRRLDYIQELGCNAIWMNPCFTSPFGDAGYDVSDYYTAAPRYGTNEDLKELFEEAHRRGMHVLLDVVPGHTSSQHPWFQESMKPEQNEYTDRYVWTDSVWETPNGMGCLKGISDRDGTCLANFFTHQPALNYGFYKPDPEKKWQQPMDAPGPRATVEAMKDVMRFWLSLGCDGFRVDMASSLVKYDEENKGTIKLWQGVREFLDREFPEAAVISEWSDPVKSLEGGFHMDFWIQFGHTHYNDLFRCEEPYFSRRGKGDASVFVKEYAESYRETREKGLICIPSGNHDIDRLARYLQGDELKVAFAFLLSMPGAPFVYYGDELGMRYVEGLTSVEGGYNRTGSRSPMQWDRSVNAGFSSAAPDRLYIPLDPAADRPNAADEMADPSSLYHEVKKLIAIRQSQPALQSCGNIEFVHVEENGYPLAYLRESGDERLLVVLNPSGREAGFVCPYTPEETVYCFGGEARIEAAADVQAEAAADVRWTVPAGSAGFYRV